jgi:16S rRNA (guanine966-N2)-methyltransferase
MRITGGEYRSRSLRAPKGTTTRPTSDRVREALFSILGSVAGGHVLDLYAGTGALGLEALSRGARAAVFVERSKEAVAALQANLQALGLASPRARLVVSPVERCARSLGDEPFDLVFADPPYADVANGEASRLLEAVAVPRMAPSALLVLEHASRDRSPDVSSLIREQERTYGDTSLSFYRSPSV